MAELTTITLDDEGFVLEPAEFDFTSTDDGKILDDAQRVIDLVRHGGVFISMGTLAEIANDGIDRVTITLDLEKTGDDRYSVDVEVETLQAVG